MLNEDIKSEVNAGLSRVIGSLFDTIVQPILSITITPLFKVVLKLGHRIIANRERKMQAEAESEKLAWNMFSEILDANGLDCLIFTLHNGVKSKENKKIHWKYISCIFNNIEIDCRNLYIEKMIGTTLVAADYRNWISNCSKNTLWIEEDFDLQTQYYFKKYKQIYFTYYRGAYIFYLYKVAQSVDYTVLAQLEMLMKNRKLN